MNSSGLRSRLTIKCFNCKIVFFGLELEFLWAKIFREIKNCLFKVLRKWHVNKRILYKKNYSLIGSICDIDHLGIS